MTRLKKGSLAADQLLGLVVFMLGSSVFMFIFYIFLNLGSIEKQNQIEVSLEDLNSAHNLNYFLSFELGNERIASDLLSEAYISNNYEELIPITNDYFGRHYSSQGLSYSIMLNGKPLGSLDFIEIVANPKAQIPIMNKEILNIELQVGKSGQIIIP